MAKTMQQRFNVTNKRDETDADRTFTTRAAEIFAAVAAGTMSPEAGQAALDAAAKQKFS